MGSETWPKLQRMRNPSDITGLYVAKVSDARKFDKVHENFGYEKSRPAGTTVCKYLITQKGDEVTMANPSSSGDVRWKREGSDESVLRFLDQSFPNMTADMATKLFPRATIMPNGTIELGTGLTLMRVDTGSPRDQVSLPLD